MESYQTWFGEGPELSVLRMLGLFDRPADERAFEALLKAPAICGLTESLTDLSPTAWRTILAKLRRARLLAREDPHNPGQLDAHPLVREYFGEQLRSQQTEAWKECNSRLFNYYRILAPQLPESFRDTEPLFLAVISGCNAGLFRAALHEVYLPRIQRGYTSFAANVLGARGALLSVLVHFFEHGRWGSPAETAVVGQSLTAEDQLFILMQAGQYLTETRGYSAPEARICYQRLESLCSLLGRPMLLHAALMGQWRYFLVTEKVTATMQIAKQIYSLAQGQNDSALIIEACVALATPLYFLGNFEAAREYARRGVQIWRAEGLQSQVGEAWHAFGCLFFEALLDWHFGEISSCQPTMAEAISLAKELNNMQALAHALWHAGWLAGDYRATASILDMPFLLALKAEALHLADRTVESLEAITEAEALVERFENRYWSAELHRLRGIFLATLGAEETQIEASFCAAINTAKKQKSVSLERRADASYSEYRRQKASGSERRGFRLPLC